MMYRAENISKFVNCITILQNSDGSIEPEVDQRACNFPNALMEAKEDDE
jgi:hypothetical protein